MPWTYSQVKAADAALSPAVADPAAAAAALNAQTTALAQPADAVDLGAVQGVLLLSGDWLKVMARAATSPSGAKPPTTQDNAIMPAKLAVELATGKPASVDSANWPSFLGLLALLVASGDVSVASQAAIEALAPLTAPMWQPPLTAGDIQTARAQP